MDSPVTFSSVDRRNRSDGLVLGLRITAVTMAVVFLGAAIWRTLRLRKEVRWLGQLTNGWTVCPGFWDPGDMNTI